MLMATPGNRKSSVYGAQRGAEGEKRLRGGMDQRPGGLRLPFSSPKHLLLRCRNIH